MKTAPPRFLPAEQLQIGSWWAAADGGQYGCVVLAVNPKTNAATVISTDGKQREIDGFKLQYRYIQCLPRITMRLEYTKERFGRSAEVEVTSENADDTLRNIAGYQPH